MGKVYRAFDTATDRVVALKVLPPHASEDPRFQQRFRREAHTAAALTDPHVVPIHGYGEIDGRLYLDMRLIEGQDLGHILADSDQPLAPSIAVRYVEQVAEALDAAHSVGLVHRDVKPSNILITRRDFVYLIDFGIAHAEDDTRVTSTGLAIGTFKYMAPERLTADGQSGPYSDIYALTCVLFECLTGSHPFAGDNIEQQIAAHLMTPPPQASATASKPPVSFDAVIKKGLAKDPSDRYQTALEFADDVRAALGVTLKPSSTATTSPKAKSPKAMKKPRSLRDEPRASPVISASAPTWLAPARVANAHTTLNAPADATRKVIERTAHDRQEPSGAFWAVLWVMVLLGYAMLAVIVIGIT